MKTKERKVVHKMNQEIIKGGRASNRGITLIALVITIIVLLILAGVTINMVLGDDGIIGQAQDASEAQKIATVKEEVELWQANNETAGYSGAGAESPNQFIKRLKDNGIITQKDLVINKPEEEITEDDISHLIQIGNYTVDINNPKKGKIENPYNAEVEWEYAFEWTGEEWIQLEEGAEITGNISAKFYENGEDTLSLIIEGTGKMGDLLDENDNDLAWVEMSDITGKVTEVKVGDGITYIGTATFLNFYNLKSVELPNSLTSIGAYAFMDCDGLESIYIPSGVTRIGQEAFDSCGKLATIDLPASLKSLELVVFMACYNLKDVYYRGAQEEWDAIQMHADEWFNQDVELTIHYNYTGQ